VKEVSKGLTVELWCAWRVNHPNLMQNGYLTHVSASLQSSRDPGRGRDYCS